MTDRPAERAQHAAMGGKVAQGAFVYLAANALTRLIGLASFAVLARILTPADFGLMGLALLVTGFLEAIVNRQFDLGLIRSRDATAAHYDTAFTLSFGWGSIAAIGTFVLAGPVAAAMETPQLADPIRVMALIPLFDGLRNPYFIDNEKRLRFHRAVYLELGARVVGTIASIALALWLRNHWALIAGLVVSAAARTALSYLLDPRRPALGLSEWSRFAGFGGWLTGAGVIEYVNRRADVAIIGGALGLREVGLYRMGVEITGIASRQLARPMKRAVLPGLAAIAADRVRLRQGYFKAQGAILGLALPFTALIVLAASEVLYVLLGPQWSDAALVVAILGPTQALGFLTAAVQALVVVEGDTRRLFMRSLFMLVTTTPLLVAGLWYGGLVGLVAAKAADRVIRAVLTLQMASRLLDIAWWEPFLRSGRSLAACAAMTLAVVVVAPIGFADFQDFRTAAELLALKALVGGAAYVAAHLGLWIAAGRPEGFETSMLAILRNALAATRRRTA